MKTFKCFDCKRDSGGEPNLVLRRDPNGPGAIRVKVCSRCQKGVQPIKVSDLAEQRAKYANWMRK